MEIHAGYLNAQPFKVQQHDHPDKQARAAGQPPKTILRSYAEKGEIVIDSETTLTGIPAESWLYQLGYQSAIDWVLEQSKEKKSSHDTFRKNFSEYSFSGMKDDVINLLRKVVTVSIETVEITGKMRLAER